MISPSEQPWEEKWLHLFISPFSVFTAVAWTATGALAAQPGAQANARPCSAGLLRSTITCSSALPSPSTPSVLVSLFLSYYKARNFFFPLCSGSKCSWMTCWAWVSIGFGSAWPCRGAGNLFFQMGRVIFFYFLFWVLELEDLNWHI